MILVKGAFSKSARALKPPVVFGDVGDERVLGDADGCVGLNEAFDVLGDDIFLAG
jgi:hypothetical protein